MKCADDVSQQRLRLDLDLDLGLDLDLDLDLDLLAPKHLGLYEKPAGGRIRAVRVLESKVCPRKLGNSMPP